MFPERQTCGMSVSGSGEHYDDLKAENQLTDEAHTEILSTMLRVTRRRRRS